jgi:hypothetical protein
MNGDVDTARIRRLYSIKTPEGRLIHQLAHEIDRLRRDPRYPKGQPWWRYAVLRGAGIPADIDGRWYDLKDMHHETPGPLTIPDHGYRATLSATNRWEQRDDGAVAVVYEWVRRDG